VGNRGFTVVETTVAFTLLLLLAALTLRGAFAVGSSSSSCARGLVAVRLASSTIAAARGEGPPDATCDLEEEILRAGTTYDLTCRWRRSPDPTLWHLRVVVGWEEGGRRRNLTAESWVWSPGNA
jgi:hypothetical protein